MLDEDTMKEPWKRALEATPTEAAQPIGRSREGRPIHGERLGRGSLSISLLGGCHADEPVGPALLRRWIAVLRALPSSHPLLARYSWWVVPDANPDGAERNRKWSEELVALDPSPGDSGPGSRGYDLAAYSRHVVREAPPDDIEFGFPRELTDEARPENRAIARFLEGGRPFVLHASLHGMGFATGPWFLLEGSWIDRTAAMRDRLRRLVRTMGYTPFDPDRGGEKGFFRIDEGFTTRPDSNAMREHFLGRGEPETAALFRPSSMEFVRSLGGDPLTVVSEMPLFLVGQEPEASDRGPGSETGTAGRLAVHRWLKELSAGRTSAEVLREAAAAGVIPMSIRDQWTLQLALIRASLEAVEGATSRG